MPFFYLTSYKPLAASKAGRQAAEKHGLKPFVDGSIRREPDLEHNFPAITCLCRTDKFAPRLRTGDIVGLMVQRRRYGQKKRQRRLTAFLRVVEVLDSHDTGAKWYRDRGQPLPNNCMVEGNPPKPFDESHQQPKITGEPDRKYRLWEAGYQSRARKFGTFVVCERLYCNLSWSATEVTDRQLAAVFGKVPGTENPGKWTLNRAEQLLLLLSLAAGLSVP